MTGVLTGFGVVAIVMAVGMLLAHVGIADAKGQRVLARVSFTGATPALMISTLATADLGSLFSHNLGASIASVVVVAVIYVVLGKLVWRRTMPELVIGSFGSSYVNAANLGFPIAAYVLGDVAAVVPMLLVQVLFLQPLGLTLLDLSMAREQGRRLSVWSVVSRPIRNPITVGALIGVGLAVTGWSLPTVLHDSVELLAALAVPLNLIAFGMSLRNGPRPGGGGTLPEVTTVVALKLVIQPLVGYLLAAHVWQLPLEQVLAVTVVAGLPTAQNVFVIAATYNRGLILARDSVFISTVGSLGTIFAITMLLHA